VSALPPSDLRSSDMFTRNPMRLRCDRQGFLQVNNVCACVYASESVFEALVALEMEKCPVVAITETEQIVPARKSGA
jgi:hypothetical protein